MAPTPSSQLLVCTFLYSEALRQTISQLLKDEFTEGLACDRFVITQLTLPKEVLQFMELTKPRIDCLILEQGSDLPALLTNLQEKAILVPTIILKTSGTDSVPSTTSSNLGVVDEMPIYHNAALEIPVTQIDQIAHHINEAMARFLHLSTEGRLLQQSNSSPLVLLTAHSLLLPQQQQLAEKLKERLGYLGIYYKRNPAHFLRNMTQQERQELVDQLKTDYRQIILSYFLNEVTLNDKIDNFANLAFFADVPVAQIVQIHMELMDEFSKQLKMEGRSDEILLDYRLTLIDTIAHLCEMYRRSIPRES